ncbi:MAG: ABC transporter substrate-binding protein [Polyangiales bacterium]
MQTSRIRQSRRAQAALAALALVALAACKKDPPPAAAKLAHDAPLPSEFPRETKLVLGDPQAQIALRLSAGLADLPFTPDFHNLTGGPQTIEAFRAEALDGGSVGDTPPIHAIFTGLDVKIVAVQQRTRPAMRIATAPGSPIASLSDLRDKRIAYSPGQAQGALVLRVLRRLGLKTSDVKLIELTSPEFKDALGSKQVDAAPLSGPGLRRYLEEYEKQGARAIEHGVRDSLSFLYVRTAVLDDPHKAAALRAYVARRTRAQLWAFTHPEPWLKAYYVEDQGLDEDDARYVIETVGRPQYPGDWSDTIALTQETIDELSRAGGMPRFDAHRLFDMRFEKVAAEAALAFEREDKGTSG